MISRRHKSKFRPGYGQTKESVLEWFRGQASSYHTFSIGQMMHNTNASRATTLAHLRPDTGSDYDHWMDLPGQTGHWPARAMINMGKAKSTGWTNTSLNLLAYHLARFASRGGIIHLKVHMENPWVSTLYNGTPGTSDAWDRTVIGSYEDLKDDASTAGELPEGSPYDNLIAMADDIAALIQKFENLGIVVVFEPFHELCYNWAWWHGYSTHTDNPDGAVSDHQVDEFIELWKWLHGYLETTKGLSNILWMFCPSVNGPGTTNQNTNVYYPGADYVDLIGLSWYSATWGDIDGGTGAQKEYTTWTGSYAHPVGFSETRMGQVITGEGLCTAVDMDGALDTLGGSYPLLRFGMAWIYWTGDCGLAKMSIARNTDATAYMEHNRAIVLSDMGAALSLDGSDDQIVLPSAVADEIDEAQNRTIEFWLRTEDDSESALLMYGMDGEGDGTRFLLRFDWATAYGAGMVRLDVNGALRVWDVSISDGQWHHIALVLDGTQLQDFVLYVDGSEATVDTTTEGTTAIDTDSSTITIAPQRTWPTNPTRLEGVIDDIRIWKEARSEANIQTYMAQRLVGNESNLVAYYKANEGAGKTLNDEVGTNDGTITGGTWVRPGAAIGG